MAAMDRISELPEPILHHILSFLSHKHAIRTSALSKPWRHVGPTRPKIELRESWFKKSDRASFLSTLGKTLQGYYHRNLSVHEFILEMSSPLKSDHPAIDSEFTNDPCKTLFKGLKRLSLNSLHIKDETTLEKIIRSCPLIEYLNVSGCAGLKTIPVTIFQAEFLTELHLKGCNLYTFRNVRGLNLIITTDQLLLINRLKTLSLERVNIPEETLDKIMSSCPLIERLLLTDCFGLRNIQLKKKNNNNNNNLKHFSGSFKGVNISSLEIHSPTIETIRIVDCSNWYGHDKYFFPCLKTLYLHRVKLSADLFESFSSNFPSLEDLGLEYCYGFQEIQLTVCSIKRLLLKTESKNPFKVTIYAPNIRNFEFSGGHYLPRLIFNSETTREWKTHLDMWFNNWLGDQDLNLPWLLQLSELLNSLRESQISLEVYCANLKVEETNNDAVFCKPVSLEHVQVKGYDVSSYFPYFLDYLFRICRPRYIGVDLFSINPITNMNKEKDQLDEFIKFKTIRNEGEVSRSYAWESDLEEISIQFRDRNSKGWHTVGVEETSFSGLKTCYPEIRFSVKWRD